MMYCGVIYAWFVGNWYVVGDEATEYRGSIPAGVINAGDAIL